MAKTALCPSCGAPVAFRSPASVMTVCDFCRSTLVRQDKDIRNIGRMAELLPDSTIIHIGTEGVYQGIHFAVIGRLQLQYDAGLWNEWHLLFDNMRSGGLSEAGGTCLITFPQALQENIPVARAHALRPGEELQLNGRNFTVTNIDPARCIAGEGELPFQVGPGYELLSIDLRDADTVASLDFSHDPPLLFTGAQVQLADLRLANTKQTQPGMPTLAAGSVKSFACPRCAAPLTVHAESICNVACGSCGAIVDANDANLRIIADAAQLQKIEPLIPLGSEGKLNGEAWEVIGFQCRQSEVAHMRYTWHEYLLFHSPGIFAWLVMNAGHWSFGQALSGQPRVAANTPLWRNESYSHFESAPASVSYVVGEFYWQVKIDDSVSCNDYISPPRLLSKEENEREVSWTLLSYIEPEEVAKAFGIKTPLPAKIGIGACQPNPHQEANRNIWRQFWWLSLVAFALQLCFMIFAPQNKMQAKSLSFSAGENETVEVQRFRFDKPATNFIVFCNTDLNNSWSNVNLFLSEKNSGAEYISNEEISYYHGEDGGESWSEGSSVGEFRFGNLPAGDYVLHADVETDSKIRTAVRATFVSANGYRGWFNYFLLQGFLLLLPLFSWWKAHKFEVGRWANSDHPMETDDEEDD